MSVSLYLAPGHGIQPDGRFDPGATFGGLVEHSQNVLVVAACAIALARSGYHDVVVESNGGTNSDPNYVGSTRRANELGALYVIEVHHNAGGTPNAGGGSEALVWTDSGSTGRLGHAIADGLAAGLGRRNRGVSVRDDLYLLSHTSGVACIPEVAFLDADHDWIRAHPGYVATAGEAVAKAFLGMVGRPYVPPGGPLWHLVDQAGKEVGTFRGLPALDAAVNRLLSAGQSRVEIHR